MQYVVTYSGLLAPGADSGPLDDGANLLTIRDDSGVILARSDTFVTLTFPVARTNVKVYPTDEPGILHLRTQSEVGWEASIGGSTLSRASSATVAPPTTLALQFVNETTRLNATLRIERG